MFILAPPIVLILEYVETRIITEAIDSSKKLLKELDKLLKGDRSFQGLISRKEVKTQVGELGWMSLIHIMRYTSRHFGNLWMSALTF